MRITKTKYNTNIIAPEYDKDDEAYIDKRRKEFNSLPDNIKVELYMGLSWIAKTYGLEYNSLLAMTKYEVGLLLLKIEDANTRKILSQDKTR